MLEWDWQSYDDLRCITQGQGFAPPFSDLEQGAAACPSRRSKQAYKKYVLAAKLLYHRRWPLLTLTDLGELSLGTDRSPQTVPAKLRSAVLQPPNTPRLVPFQLDMGHATGEKTWKWDGTNTATEKPCPRTGTSTRGKPVCRRAASTVPTTQTRLGGMPPV
ncbi:hypothetical protein PWT90_06300 [Aphanocladium album]|nr:hypothetical protein PWT90_06300 [Aphanocladium album]